MVRWWSGRGRVFPIANWPLTCQGPLKSECRWHNPVVQDKKNEMAHPRPGEQDDRYESVSQHSSTTASDAAYLSAVEEGGAQTRPPRRTRALSEGASARLCH